MTRQRPDLKSQALLNVNRRMPDALRLLHAGSTVTVCCVCGAFLSCSPPHFSETVSHWNWSSWTWLGWLVSKVIWPGVSHPCLLSTQLQMNVTIASWGACAGSYVCRIHILWAELFPKIHLPSLRRSKGPFPWLTQVILKKLPLNYKPSLSPFSSNTRTSQSEATSMPRSPQPPIT